MCIQLPSVGLIQLHSVAFLDFADDADNAFDHGLPFSREFHACDARSSTVMYDFVLLDFVMMDWWSYLMVAGIVCRLLMFADDQRVLNVDELVIGEQFAVVECAFDGEAIHDIHKILVHVPYLDLCHLEKLKQLKFL